MAKVDWHKVLGWDEDQIDDIRHVGYAYIRQGKYDIALSFFEALVVLCPDSAYDCQTLGAIYLQIGNGAKAVKYLDKALKADADHAPTLLNLAKAFFLLGKKEEGLKLAHLLENERSAFVSNTAKALILAYG